MFQTYKFNMSGDERRIDSQEKAIFIVNILLIFYLFHFQNHDAEVHRQFASSCSATGGGRGPAAPPGTYMWAVFTRIRLTFV